VGRKGPIKKTDYGTVILHWLLAGALLIAITTGFRIATETPDRVWLNALSFILPQSIVWNWHMESAVVLIGISIAYVIYVSRVRLSQRLRLDRVRLRGLLGRPYARWGAINVLLYWLFFAVVLSQFATGTLMYLSRASSIMVQLHWYGTWFIIGYVALHIFSQWRYGGTVQLMRVFRPARIAAAPPQFELADVLALLDEQASPSLAPQQPTLAKAYSDAPQVGNRAATARSEQVFARSPLPDGDVGKPPRGPARPNSPPEPPKQRFAFRLNAFLVACVIAGLAVVVMLTAERQFIDRLYVHRIDPADVPVIDGETSDSIWRKIPPIYVLTEEGGNFAGTGETSISVQAVHDATRAYFLFVWDDPTRSLKQLPLQKTSAGWQLLHQGYEIGDEHAYNEDKFSVLFTSLQAILAGDLTFHAGTAPIADEPHTLSGRGLHYTMREGVYADVVEWKATSTNASSYCDHDHFGPPVPATEAQFEGLTPYHGGFGPNPGTVNYQDNFTPGPNNSYTEGVVPRRLPKDVNVTNGALGRIDLDPDHGEGEMARWYLSEDDSVPYSMERDRLIPAGTVVPGVFISGKYSGERGDVRCAGRWAAGRWALEMTRRLEGTSPYEVTLRTGTSMRVSAFDHAQIQHTRHVRPIRLEVE
jgi:Ethylbenzene dehydrogenase/Prokaryotic cytochrome b561